MFEIMGRDEMENIMILVTGMPAAGKSTFAAYLSEKLHIPLVCYDHIKGKEWDLIHNTNRGCKKFCVNGNTFHEELTIYARHSTEVSPRDSEGL
jgi:adenylate kinase family enzyme